MIGTDPSSGRPGKRFEDRFRGRTARAIANGTVVRYLALVMLLLSLSAAFAVRLVDRADFPTFGDALWWAIVTLGTVGYGDIVPHSSWGRVVGSVVILFGVTLIAVLTATVTSYFVAANQAALAADIDGQRDAAGDEALVLLRQIIERLDAIDAERGTAGDGSPEQQPGPQTDSS